MLGLASFQSRGGFRGVSGFIGRLGFALGGIVPPLNSLFYWPFFTDSLDEVLEGNDATYTNSVDNVPVFDGNGWLLTSADSSDATVPISTSQVDANHGQSGTGTFALTGKYAGTEAAAMIGGIFVDEDNVLTATITGAVAATSITVIGTVSAADKLFWHTSAYTLAGVKALLNSVGDQGSNVDTRYYEFDGVADYVSIPLWTSSGDFEVEFTFICTDTSLVRNHRILGDTSNAFNIVLNSGTGRINAKLKDSGGSAIFLSGIATDYADGVEHVGKIIRVGDDFHFEVDGFVGTPSTFVNAQNVTYDRIAASDVITPFQGVIRNINLNNERLYKINDGKGSTEIVDSIGGQNGTPVSFVDANWQGGWVDVPVNDMFIETEFYIDHYDTTGRAVWSRMLGADYQTIGYIEKAGSLVLGYESSVSANTESAGAIITSVDLTKPFKVRANCSSATTLTDVTVTHNGATYTDSLSASQTVTQSTYIDLKATLAATIGHTIVYTATGDL